MNEPNIVSALIALGIRAGWKIKEGKIVKWWAEKEQPSDEAIQTKLSELQAEYDSKQYQRDRAEQYPSIQDQLDMQYHDSVNGTTTWKDAVAKVKADNPKPE